MVCFGSKPARFRFASRGRRLCKYSALAPFLAVRHAPDRPSAYGAIIPTCFFLLGTNARPARSRLCRLNHNHLDGLHPAIAHGVFELDVVARVQISVSIYLNV